MVLYPWNPKYEFNSRTLSGRKLPLDLRSGLKWSWVQVEGSWISKTDNNSSKWNPSSGRYAKLSGPGMKK